jgi:hypothetical protein
LPNQVPVSFLHSFPRKMWQLGENIFAIKRLDVAANVGNTRSSPQLPRINEVPSFFTHFPVNSR